MKRGEFISQIGLSSQALLAFYCFGATSCKNSDVEAQPNNVPIKEAGLTGNAESGSGKIDFSLDLTLPVNAPLKTAGGFVRVGSVLVAQTLKGAYVAVAKFCTHSAGVLVFQPESDDFWCPVHGSLFNLDGTVKQSPAPVAVKLYKVEINADKTRLSVKE